MVDDFRFVAGHVRGAVPKMTIPSPSVMHFRGGREAISKQAYPDMSAYFDDLAKLYAHDTQPPPSVLERAPEDA